MIEYVPVPRRHSLRTLGLLLKWYIGAGLLGMAVSIISAGVYAGFSTAPDRQTFLKFLAPIAAVCVALLVYIWHKYVQPRIQHHREEAISDFDAIMSRKYKG